jgi:hypothetical protein
MRNPVSSVMSAEPSSDPEHEAEIWAEKIADRDLRRSAYQGQQAAGLMALEELGSKLKDLDNARRTAERKLTTQKDRRHVKELETDRDALLGISYQDGARSLTRLLTGEEKHRIYRMLRLEVTPTIEGYNVSGARCTSVTLSAAGERPRAVSPVTVVGRIADGIEDCRRVSSGERLRIEAAGEQ